MEPYPILIVDADGIIRQANGTAIDRFGPCLKVPCAEIIGVKNACGSGQCEDGCASRLQTDGTAVVQRGQVAGEGARVVCSAVGSVVVVQVHPDEDGSALRAALTPREYEIVSLTASGLTGKQIADQLGVSAATVRTHVEHAKEKLGAANRAELMAKAVVMGLLEAR